MKNFTLFIATLFVAGSSIAQVQVNNDAFIYSKGTDIFITKGLVLRDAPSAPGASDGSAFYLREGAIQTGVNAGKGNGNIAHLIQGDPALIDISDPIGNNGGNGTLSVFQEGVANNFTYNYWSSPVSESGAGSNAGFKNTQMYFPLLMENFPFETDFVIDAEPAFIFDTSVRDGRTDNQEYTNNTTQTGPTIVNQPLRIASRWLYSYNSVGDGAGNGGTQGYFGWQSFAPSAATVLPGYGFTMKGVILDSGVNLETSSLGQGQRYDFRGIPNNGDIEVGVAQGDFSLIGNPYPSALDLKDFLFDNPEITPEIYFWDSQSTTHLLIEYEGGYGVYTPGAMGIEGDDGEFVPATFIKYDENGVPISGSEDDVTGGPSFPVGAGTTRRYAPVGQGFMIVRDNDVTGNPFAVGSKGTATFSNSQRDLVKENNSNSFFKAAPGSGSDQSTNANTTFVRPKIIINTFINKSYNRQMILSFGEGATLGYDWGLEGSNNANRVNTDIYMPLENNEYVIQSVPFSKNETAVPVAFKTANNSATFQIRVATAINFDTEKVLIHDKQTNTYHDILNDSYTITTEKGLVDDRYEIVFEEKSTLSNGDEILTSNAFNIFQNNERSLLTILNPASKEVSNISVFDLAGRLVAQQSPKEANQEFTFNTTSYSTGIYIVKVATRNDEEMAQKVIISN
ncbi:Por secretion system C-terminal sorting domain-containing protein [Nonlabens sp. Hel1_33_55]|uniref:T9SS type A sorting domain-containing protein n=1 Tax=Nonlabens sp. Hel1_33_55 TaxID=1336802 RepID=UPI000875B91C|nr:T9SS type A sorting domain-containing protein [Nonlabens sp. Hel1_33_55]SCX89808.1 Por secretion system C-terminal sorting domain-containing protein [Nonlabens sp. Hel1_33_55]